MVGRCASAAAFSKMVMSYLTWWQDGNENVAGGRDLLVYSILLFPLFYKESKHDWTIVDWQIKILQQIFNIVLVNVIIN